MGAPLPPTVTSVTGGVGRLSIEWSAPAINADLDTTYTLAIYDVTPGTRNPVDVPIEDLPLTVSPKVVTQLVAGTKRVQITATNINAGPSRYTAAVKSALADEADAALCNAPAIPSSNGLVGSTQGANISVNTPSQMSTTALNKFLIQVGLGGWLMAAALVGCNAPTAVACVCRPASQCGLQHSQRCMCCHQLPLTCTAECQQQLQAYHDSEDTELGKPRQVDANPADSAGPWTVFWAQTAPQFLRFKVGEGAECRWWWQGTACHAWRVVCAVAQPAVGSALGATRRLIAQFFVAAAGCREVCNISAWMAQKVTDTHLHASLVHYQVAAQSEDRTVTSPWSDMSAVVTVGEWLTLHSLLFCCCAPCCVALHQKHLAVCHVASLWLSVALRNCCTPQASPTALPCPTTLLLVVLCPSSPCPGQLCILPPSEKRAMVLQVAAASLFSSG